MFNFFNEVKEKVGLKGDALYDYNIVNISGKLLYAEGHKGLLVLSETKIVFKLRRGHVEVLGKGMMLAELSENTLIVQGKIESVGTFDV